MGSISTSKIETMEHALFVWALVVFNSTSLPTIHHIANTETECKIEQSKIKNAHCLLLSNPNQHSKKQSVRLML